MPTFEVKIGNSVYDVDAPDENTAWTWANHSHRSKPEPIKIGKAGFSDALQSVIGETGAVGRNLAAAGTAASNLWEGAKQLVGNGDDQNIQANRQLASAAPVGAFLGNAALVGPTAMIPGANTLAGAGLVGATQGLLQPTQGDESRLTNTAIGGALGAAGQYGGNKLGEFLTSRLAAKEAEAAANASKNSVRDATLNSAKNVGYVVPPSTTNPSWINKRLESIAGKAAIGQEAASRNQQVTDSLIRKALGMADDAPITESSLKQIRDIAAQPYRDIAALSPEAKDALDLLKQARFDSNAQFKFYNRSADPSALAKAKTLQSEAQGWEKFIQNEAAAKSGDPLVESLKQARQKIAKTYTVDKALNTSTGEVDARILGRMIDRGEPLTSELATAARFADAFPQYAREGARIPTPGVSKSEAILASLLAGGGAVAAGPVGAIAGALPFASTPVRSMLLSRPYQALMAAPKYGPGLATKALGNLTPERAALMARALALGSTAQ